MIESKGWNWKIVKEDKECIWKNPSIESYYLLNRWKNQEKKEFLDLGCGLGRHSILFAKNGFNVYCFDISEEAIKRTKAWAEEEKLELNYNVGDMLNLPYKDESIDAILCRNVISHTDTEGMKKVIKEIEKFYKKYKVPSYCKGTIQNGKIYFLFNTQIEEKTYKYELELRKILHEYIHILYNEYIATPNTRITWLDEGIALNLSRERGKFVKEKYPILKSNIDKINLNNLQHESESFVTDKINGYDVSYLTVKYLMETLSKEEFNKLIRKNEDILKMRKRNLRRSKEIF